MEIETEKDKPIDSINRVDHLPIAKRVRNKEILTMSETRINLFG
jgi:hypothetical protein